MENTRYAGFGWSLDYRPSEPSWPAPYRLRILPNKQERQEYRIVVYGLTEQEAHTKAAYTLREFQAEV